MVVLEGLIAVNRQQRKLRNQLQALPHHVGRGKIVGIFVVGIKRQHATGENVHHVLSGRLEDHIPHEGGGQRAVLGELRFELRGKYYEYSPNAPIELMFHGYRGNSESDLSGGVLRCFALGRSVLLVDHRASGRSEGKVISFGVNESKDCLKWLDFLNNKFENAKIILSGISMGASTILMASGKDLPKNVIGVIADCGYTSPKEIIKTVIKQMKLPPNLAYPFVKLGAKIYGKFNLEEDSPIEAVKKAQIPIIFFHGDCDDYVPYEMSVKNYDACVSRKKLVTVKGAGHGLAYIVDPDEYLKELNEFFTPLLSDKEE